MWILKRLSELGVSVEDKLMTYESRIRIFLEQNVALWHFSISKKLSHALEKVQRSCVIIILGKLATTDYFCNLTLLNLEPLADRREKLCIKFAKKTFKHPVHRTMFQINPISNTRDPRKVIVPKAKTVRYEKSSVPSLARMINSL